MVKDILSIVSEAVVPDQLSGYVNSIADFKMSIHGQGILYEAEKEGILVIYPISDPFDEIEIENSVSSVLKHSSIKNITVLAPISPKNCPQNSIVKKDRYWFIDLPGTPNAKTRNLVKRASREVEIILNNWSKQHEDLVKDFCERKGKNLDEGTKYIYSRLNNYLDKNKGAILFSAHLENGRLMAFAIGDYSSKTTAFYMFAFRNPLSPPGTADLLLQKISEAAIQRGQQNLNLGLGITKGIEFFKRKWNGKAILPYVETSWQIHKKNWFSTLFKK